MYKRTEWKDHVTQYPNRRKLINNGDGTQDVVKAQGEVIQQGTAQSATNFNNMEVGISDAHLALALMQFKSIQESYNEAAELHVLTLAQNGDKWPFNNRETTVALSQMRENTNYSVEVAVLEYSGGRLGDIRVYDRAKNGFKLMHDGSASVVKVAVRVSGGMTDQRVTDI